MTDPPIGLEKPLVAQVSDIAQPGVAGGLVDTTVDAGLELRTRSQWSYARTRFLRHRLAMGGLFGLILLFAAGIFANYLAPYPVDQIDLTKVLSAPTTVGHHFLGTDEIGRDFLSRIIFGIRTSEEVGIFVAVVSSILGLIVGAIAGFYSGLLDNILMRITDLTLTLPLLAVLLTVSALKGEGSQWRISIILALF